MRVCVLLVFGLLVSSCTSNYVEPSDNNVARMRFVAPQTETLASLRIITYPSGECESPQSMGMIGGMARFMSDKKLGIPTNSPLDEKLYIERKIRAGEKFMFSVRSILMNSICTNTVEFIPEPNKDYEVKHTWDNQKCSLSINQVLVKNGSVELAPVRNVGHKTPSCGKGFSTAF